jgi:hypothetical protein
MSKNKPATPLNHLKRAYRAICDRCGYKFYNWQLKKEWTGLMVCSGPETNDCWEPRHAQDFLRPVKEDNKLPWTRPEPEDEFITTECTIITRSGFAGYGACGCMLAGQTFGSGTFEDFLSNYVCDVNGVYAMANIGTAGCATAGKFF